MSYIWRRIDGTYEVAVDCQDGVDRYECPDEATALATYRSAFAFVANCRPEAVEPPAIVDKGAWPVVVGEAGRRVTFADDRVRDAIRLAVARAPSIEEGRRYELRVELVPVAGPPGFLGAGI